MLKMFASVCFLLGSIVIGYIATSGHGGRSTHSAPSWIYSHY
jgi:hypothetical protein